MNGRRVFAGWFGLIVLYTALTQSDKVAGLLGLTTAATSALSDPSKPLIPDRTGSSSSSTSSSSSPQRSNSATTVYGPNGGQYIGGTFIPNPPPMDPRGGAKDSKK